jgi:iron complex outermembrane receptor protein
MGRFTYQMSGNTTAFVEAEYTKTETKYTGNPPTLSAASPTTWLNVAGQRFSYQLVLPVGHPDNPNPFPVGLIYRFADLGTTYTKTTLDSSRVVAGFNGVWGAWDWESAILYAENKRADEQNNILHFPTLVAAVNSGTYRFSGNGTNSQALLDSLHPTIFYDAKTTTSSWDLKGSREVWNMQAGPMMLATGLEIRKEEFNITTDPRVLRGEMLGIAAQTVDADRNIWSIYGELSIPLLKNLELQAAARYDDYSDFGGKATPKVGFKWNAMETLAFRGTWAMGFRAPSLYQSQTGDVQSFNAGIVDPLRCPNQTTPAPGGEPEDCSRTISSLIRANKNLEPETSTSNSLGMIWAPNTNVSASIDRFYIHRKNFVDRYSSPFVITQNFNGNPAFADAVIRDPNPATWLPGIPNSGPIQTTIRRFDNFGDAIVQGFDLDVSTKWSAGAWGRVGLEYFGTYYDKYIWQFTKGEAYINAAGNFYGPFETPRYRGQLNATWDIGAFTFIGHYTYTGSWEYGQPAGTNAAGQTVSAPQQCFTLSAAQQALMNGCTVGSYETIDLGVTWTGIKNLKVGALVRNVTNRVPPYDPSSNATTLGFTPAFYNPYGRYLQFSLTYKFK